MTTTRENAGNPVLEISEPNRLWTTKGVASEMHADLLSPMCWSVWCNALEGGSRTIFTDLGILPMRERSVPEDPNRHVIGCFYGRLAINVDYTRQLFGALPGVTGDDYERDMLGSVRPDVPPEPSSPGRVPIMLVKAPKVMALAGRAAHATHQSTLGWWQTEVLDGPGPDAPIARFLAAVERFTRAMAVHMQVRTLNQMAQSALARACVSAGIPADREAFTGGVGDLVETRVGEDVWRLAHGRLTMPAFLRTHGYHGPAEGNLLSHSWRERPALVEPLVQAYARHPGTISPGERDRQAAAARRLASQHFVAAFPSRQRRLIGWLLARTANLFRNVQLCRASYVMCIDGCRAAARDVARALLANGALDEIDDAFFLTIDELRRLDSGRLDGTRELVATRRQQRAEYYLGRLPEIFTGTPALIPAKPTDPRARMRGASSNGANAEAIRVSGTGVFGGRIRGRARVVLDLDDAAEIGPGDVLVCRNTDPSWTPLMGLVDALVVDVGGPSSHAAIVARELGIPCVIGTAIGSSTIPDGSVIEVDADAGTVQVTSTGECVVRQAV